MIVRLLLGLLLLASEARAATSADLALVNENLRIAAAPWCGRLAELDASGTRRCSLAAKPLVLPGKANAMALPGQTYITEEMLKHLDVDELAMVAGHELAHVLLGHGIFRLRQIGGPGSGSVLAFVESLGPPPHEDTPADPREQELDADRLGLILAGLAGYKVRHAAELWRTAAQRLPGFEKQGGSSHPDADLRLRRARETAQHFCAPLAVPSLSERLLPAYEASRDELQRLFDGAGRRSGCAGKA